MILVDTNLLVYAFVSTYSQHEAAKEWLDSRLNAAAPVGLPWASLLGFLRLVTNPRIYGRPATLAQVRHGDGCRSTKFFRMSVGLGKVCTTFGVKTEPLR